MRRLTYTLPNGETTTSYSKALAAKATDTYKMVEIDTALKGSKTADGKDLKELRLAHFGYNK